MRRAKIRVAHGDVDRERVAGLLKSKLEQAGLGECPAGKGRGFGAGLVFEANLRIAMLQLVDDMEREGSATGDFGAVLGHLAKDVRGAVGEEEDGGGGCGLVMLVWCDPAQVLSYVGRMGTEGLDERTAS